MYPEIAASVETLGKKLQDETEYENFRLKLFSEKSNPNQGLITKLDCFNPYKTFPEQRFSYVVDKRIFNINISKKRNPCLTVCYLCWP